MFFFLFNKISNAATTLVYNSKELKISVANAKFGDTILLANKRWTDVISQVNGKGTAQKPIVIMPENKISVSITGQSSINIGSEHLINLR